MRLLVGGSRISEIELFGSLAMGNVVICVRNLDVDAGVAGSLAQLVKKGSKVQVIYAKRYANVSDLALVAALPSARYWQSPLAVEDMLVSDNRAYLGSLAQDDFGAKSRMVTAVSLDENDANGLEDARGYLKTVMSKARERDVAVPMTASSAIAKQMGIKTPLLLERMALLGYLVREGESWLLSDKGFNAGCEHIATGPWSPYFLWPDSVVKELKETL